MWLVFKRPRCTNICHRKERGTTELEVEPWRCRWHFSFLSNTSIWTNQIHDSASQCDVQEAALRWQTDCRLVSVSLVTEIICSLLLFVIARNDCFSLDGWAVGMLALVLLLWNPRNCLHELNASINGWSLIFVMRHSLCFLSITYEWISSCSWEWGRSNSSVVDLWTELQYLFFFFQ